MPSALRDAHGGVNVDSIAGSCSSSFCVRSSARPVGAQRRLRRTRCPPSDAWSSRRRASPTPTRGGPRVGRRDRPRRRSSAASPATPADLLRFHAGLDIARNGGPGQTTSLFIRGAESNHTLVMVDGVRINPGTIGQPGAAEPRARPDRAHRGRQGPALRALGHRRDRRRRQRHHAARFARRLVGANSDTAITTRARRASTAASRATRASLDLGAFLDRQRGVSDPQRRHRGSRLRQPESHDAAANATVGAADLTAASLACRRQHRVLGFLPDAGRPGLRQFGGLAQGRGGDRWPGSPDRDRGLHEGRDPSEPVAGLPRDGPPDARRAAGLARERSALALGGGAVLGRRRQVPVLRLAIRRNDRVLEPVRAGPDRLRRAPRRAGGGLHRSRDRRQRVHLERRVRLRLWRRHGARAVRRHGVSRARRHRPVRLCGQPGARAGAVEKPRRGGAPPHR